MKITDLANEYEHQYDILNAKIDGLRPLLHIYRGEDLLLLRRKIKTYYDMATQCRIISNMLAHYYDEEDNSNGISVQ